MRRTGSSCLGCAMLVLALGAPVHATGTGLAFDLSVMPFQYNVGSGPGGKVGTITISDGIASVMVLKQLDLGSDGAIAGGGTAADIELDLASISDATLYSTLFQADVIKIGANNYRLEGTFAISDTATGLADAPVVASLVSGSVNLMYGFLSFDGTLTPGSGNDAILRGTDGSWAFQGAATTPATPDLDGVRGQVSLASGRSYFDSGLFNGGYYTGSPSLTLDSFFAANRSTTSISMQMAVMPEPTTAVGAMLLLAAGLMRRSRRA